MTHVSASVYTLWSIISTTFFCFLISHLWKFDHFESLKWRPGRQKGAFKRVMTFTYLLGLPCIMVYSIGMMVIKYREGYTNLPGFGIVPTPYQLWSPEDQKLLLKFFMVFAVAWGLEIVTHLEELCFWFFLVSVGPSHASWFGSIHFKLWAVGSILGLAGLPIVTWLTRHDPLTCEAWTFMAGAAASLIVTLGGLRVLWVFPRFLQTVKSAGGEPEVVIRLTTFHDLNVIRVIFRFVFTVPLFILAIDGVQGHHHINESALWTDLLASLGGLGLITSSCMTLLIFFPRSIEREAGYKPRRSSGRGMNDEISLQPVNGTNQDHQATTYEAQSRIDDNPFAAPGASSNASQAHFTGRSGYGAKSDLIEEYEEDAEYAVDGMPPPNYGERPQLYRYESNPKRTELWEIVTSPSEIPLATAHPRSGGSNLPQGVSFGSGRQLSSGMVPRRPPRHDLHPMIMNYSSPLNFGQDDAAGPSRQLHRPQNAV